MNELYWITRFDGILTVIIIPMAILLVAAFIHFCLSCDNSFEDDERKVFRKRTAVFGSIGMFLFLVQAFIPTTNETAKKLPDKVIIALDKYLDTFNKEEKK